MKTTEKVLSPDGTPIAFERSGSGDPLILVEPAGHYRGHSAFATLRPTLEERFTVYGYDRRGRGESGDSVAYAPEREVEDLAAVVESAGRPAFVYGYSSGALLALHAGARGVPMAKLAVLEPPLQEPGAEPDPLTAELAVLVAEKRFADAVEHFHRSIGVPDPFIEEMRSTEAFAKMTAIAPTLVYDCRISEATTNELLASVQLPTLVLDSEGSTDDLVGWAARVARLLPCATHRSLPGRWHTVDEDLLTATLVAYFTGEGNP